MNLWDKKLGLLILVALSFFACEEEIGLTNITPENNLGIFFAEYPLEGNVNQIWAGSSPSTFSGRALAGVMEDSVFGKITATPYFDYLLTSFNYDTLSIETAEITSAELEIRISTAYGNYLDADLQSFDIYSTDYIQGVDSKNSASSEPLIEKIGSGSFNIIRDSVTLNTSFYDNDTSLYDESKFDINGNYIYNKSFDFTSSFIDALNTKFKAGVNRGKKNINDSNDTDSIYYFVQKELDEGFAIIPNSANTAIAMLNVITSQTYDFIVNYKVTNAVGTEIDQQMSFTLTAYNNITPNEASPWVGGRFNGLSSINSTMPSSNDYLYYQAGTNMLMEIDLTDFTNLEDTIPNAVIQKAVLSIANPVKFTDVFAFPNSVGVYLTNSENKGSGKLSNTIEANVLKDLPNNAVLDTTSNAYLVELPLYLQSLTDKKISYDKLIIGLDSKLTDQRVGSDEGFSAFGVKKEDIKLTYYYSVTN